MELKEILFEAARLEVNRFQHSRGDEKDKAGAAFCALYAVIEQAGLEDEYQEWKGDRDIEGAKMIPDLALPKKYKNFPLHLLTYTLNGGIM